MKQTRHCRENGRPSRAAGFTLVEVLVALIIIAVGMLGLAKIQALAYASTGIAGSQSLAALQASSLVSAMRANRSYWSTVANGFTFSNTGGTLASSDNTLTTTTYACASGGADAPCTPAHLAAYDLNAWSTALTAVLPKSTATIGCATSAGCYIKIDWVENNVNVNTQTQGNALTAPTYTVFVVP